MSASQLKVDYDQLTSLETRLNSAADNMRDDRQTMEALASAVGDAKLADRIRDFSSDWSINRANIRENVEWLREKVAMIADELESLDSELAKGLTTPAASTPATPRGPMPV